VNFGRLGGVRVGKSAPKIEKIKEKSKRVENKAAKQKREFRKNKQENKKSDEPAYDTLQMDPGVFTAMPEDTREM